MAFISFLPCRLQQGAREKILRKQNNVEAVPEVGSKVCTVSLF